MEADTIRSGASVYQLRGLSGRSHALQETGLESVAGILFTYFIGNGPFPVEFFLAQDTKELYWKRKTLVEIIGIVCVSFA